MTQNHFKKLSIASMIERGAENWPETSEPASDISLCIVRLNDMIMEQCKRVTIMSGISEAGFEVLTTLRSFPKPRRLTPTELYRSILISSGGMTKVTNQLQAKGLVCYVENTQDKRSKLIEITAAGEKLIEIAMREAIKIEKEILSNALSNDEIASLRNILVDSLAKIEGD